MKELQVGEVYYRVSFADTDLKIPRVEPWVFVGINLFPEHEEPGEVSYYFREPPEQPGEPVAEYYVCAEERLSWFYTLVEVIAKLTLVAAGVDLTKPAGRRGLGL